MRLLTFAEARDTRLKQVANLCNTSDEFKALLNEAVQRLMIRGDFAGLIAPVAMCLDGPCVTWPRFVGNVRKAKFGNRNMQVTNSWYQFLDGPDAQSCFCGNDRLLTLLATGNAATYRDIKGQNQKVRFYVDCVEDAGKEIILRDFIGGDGQPLKEKDANGNWLYQKTLTLANQYVSTSEDIQQFGRVHLPDTIQCRIRVYAYDTVNDTLLDLAIYEPGETDPWYSRSQIKGSFAGCNATCSGITRFIAEVKLQFVPIVKDTDLVLISNIGALKNTFMAIRYEEDGEDGKALNKWALAVRELNHQLRDESMEWQTPVAIEPFGGLSYTNQTI